MRRCFLQRSIIETAMILHASMIMAVVFVVSTAGCSSPSNPNSPSPTPTPTPALPNVAGTWTLVMTTTTPVRPYSTYTVTLVQNGTTLTGSILPVGTTRPTSISLGSVTTAGEVVFGSEHAWWNDVGDTVGSDLYVHLTIDSTGNRMTGSCPPSACGIVTATRTGPPPIPAPTPSPAGSSMSAKINGVTWTVVNGAGFPPGTVEGGSFGGGVFVVGGNTTAVLSIRCPCTRPGTYPTASADALKWGVGLTILPQGQSWELGSGSVTVTTLTATGASGTFFFTLVPITITGATGNRSVTEGVFNVTF